MGRFIPVLLAATLVASGCGSDADPKGTWVYDVEATKANAREVVSDSGEAVPEGMLNLLLGMFDELEFTVEIKGDGTYERVGKRLGHDQTEKGTWKLEGETLTITVTEKDGEKLEDPKVGTAVIDGDEIRIRGSGDSQFPLVLTRK